MKTFTLVGASHTEITATSPGRNAAVVGRRGWCLRLRAGREALAVVTHGLVLGHAQAGVRRGVERIREDLLV